MPTINPYLNLPGTSEEAFTFYKSVFGGEFITVQRFKDTPEAGRLTPELQEKIMHIALPIGGNVLMATDALEEMGHGVKPGTNFHISVSPDSEEETNRIFDALSAKGRVTIPLQKQFWGALFGMVTDNYGIQWMVNYDSSRKS